MDWMREREIYGHTHADADTESDTLDRHTVRQIETKTDTEENVKERRHENEIEKNPLCHA